MRLFDYKPETIDIATGWDGVETSKDDYTEQRRRFINGVLRRLSVFETGDKKIHGEEHLKTVKLTRGLDIQKLFE